MEGLGTGLAGKRMGLVCVCVCVPCRAVRKGVRCMPVMSAVL